MVFQPIRCTASGVAIGTGELLPRLFTLIPLLVARKTDGYFLLHFYTLEGIFLLGRMVPIVARTFLPASLVKMTGRTMRQPPAPQRY